MRKDVTFLYGIKIAHRGLYDNKKIPENSKLAFRRALLKNMPIELDVQLLSDDTLVVFHDENLKRMTGYNKKISECTFEEIKKIPLLSTSSKIMKFEDVLSLVSGKVLLDIELKKSDRAKALTEKVLETLEEYQGPFILKSFDPRCLYFIKKKKPKFILGLLISTNKSKRKNWKNQLLTRFIILPLIRPDFLAYDKRGIKEKWVQRFRRKKPVLVWTVQENDLEKYQDFADGYLIEK